MNEIIKALFIQAGGSIEEENGNLWTYSDDLDPEKFAQLVVRECARIARATPCPYDDEELRQRLGHTWDMASLAAGQEIVTHFGVEE